MLGCLIIPSKLREERIWDAWEFSKKTSKMKGWGLELAVEVGRMSTYEVETLQAFEAREER